MHVMQVVAYLRMLIEWPESADYILESVQQAMYLEYILPDFKKRIFEEEEEEEKEEGEEEEKSPLDE